MRTFVARRFVPGLSIFSTAIALAALGSSWSLLHPDAPARAQASASSPSRGGEGGPPTIRGRSRFPSSPNVPVFDLEVLDQPLVQRVWVDWMDSDQETFGAAVSFNQPEPGDWSVLDVEAPDAYVWDPENDAAIFVRVRAYVDEDAPVTATPDCVFTEFLVFDSGWTNFGSPDE